MKKVFAIVLCFVISMSFAGCKKDSGADGSSSVPGDSEPSNSNSAEKWFDCLNGDETLWDGEREYIHDAFPGVIFRCQSEKLDAVTDGKTVTLYGGMPIWNVYFCDLTGDGKPEICSTVSWGSGISDNRIIVFDYTDGSEYLLSDRGNFDYVLNLKGGSLIGEKRAYRQEEITASGELILSDNTIQIKTDK